MKQTLAVLMGEYKEAEILCGNRNEVVRRLKVVGENLQINAMICTIEVPLTTELVYQPWVMDRGSLLFVSLAGTTLKFCTEWDIIRFPDGTERRIESGKSFVLKDWLK